MQEIRVPTTLAGGSGPILLGGFLLACTAAAVAIGSFPLAASIGTIFVFAGLHNWMEFRYFAARMPVRWGRSKLYYKFGIGGVIVLAAAYITLYFASGNWLWSLSGWTAATAAWDTAFVLWIAGLFYLHGRLGRRRDLSWAFPAAFFAAALAWLAPQYWSLALVYLHPFVAMWFLERQIRRSKPEWLRAYHLCLASIPVFLIAIWIALAGSAPLPEDTNLFWRIGQHAGSEILPGVSSRLLVTTHVFLESLHYAVWIVLIPLADKRALPWRLAEIPLFANKNGYPRVALGLLGAGAAAVILLWFGFAVDYTMTRDIYFTFAIGHVLAEFPFLVKMS